MCALGSTSVLRGLAIGGALGLGLLGGACGPTPAPAAAPTPSPSARPATAPDAGAEAAGENNPLYDAAAIARLRDAPALKQRVLASPHAYFRYTNRAFAREVCTRFDSAMPIVPTVNLHGDAHIEQYAITSTGFGLTDFDDSSQGPAVLDLVRFGVSLRLVCEAKGWAAQCPAWGAFVSGYRRALMETSYEPKAPPVVERIRRKFSGDRIAALARAEALMKPIGERQPVHLEGPRAYVEQMLVRHPELKRDFFTIKKEGRLTAGVGSALDEKYLFRVEGPSKQVDDDLILEAKAVRDLSGIQCIRGLKPGDVMRILTGQARIAKHPYRYVGYVIRHPLKGDDEYRSYWVHAWEDEYVELGLKDVESAAGLAAVAEDVGVQLAKGHPNQIADPHGDALRRDLLDLLGRLSGKLETEIARLAQLTTDAWRQAKRESR